MTYQLNSLGPAAFQNLVNALAMKVLGSGTSTFGPGSDGGRDGYFEGEAPYPSEIEHWTGTWYIQSKYHAPNLSSSPQKWLISQVTEEIKLFEKDDSTRRWPSNWIIATNIDPSGKPETGSFDVIRNLLKKSKKGKKVRLSIWGGRKILDLLAMHEDIARYYGHFLTPGQVLTELYSKLGDESATITEVIRYLVATQFREQIYTKLDQAGSSGDTRPGVHDLFIDLPFSIEGSQGERGLLSELSQAVAECHRYSLRQKYPDSWRRWLMQSVRARNVLIKGGPGQGKSTIGQYLSQIHRAKLILADDGPAVLDAIRQAADAVRTAAERDGYWPSTARIPVQIELKEYAQWFSQAPEGHSRGVLAYLSQKVSSKLGFNVPPKLIKRSMAERTWLVVFDGLDEVPHDSKDGIATEVLEFLNDLVIEVDADVFAICTSRPQGYAGQFEGIEGPVVNLQPLNSRQALDCAKPLLRYERSVEEADRSIQTLAGAMKSASVTELMTTPLQSHIMAVVVRDGGRPPERRWALFNTFYLVMKRREGLKNFQDPKISRLLQEEDRLLKAVHMRLGFVLHARAETSEGAQTKLSRAEFEQLVRGAVLDLGDHDTEGTVSSVMDATTERLVLVNTPESGEHVRFDIRQLQEFFAAEFIYDGVSPQEVAKRVECIGGDAHWREVMHFLVSALIENRRSTELAVATQVLRRLNEGDDFSQASKYYRKSARATLLASRLLQEGVVEQDQRDRQQLRPLFEPIGGIFDIEGVLPLASIAPPRSRSWLIQLLLDKISTANPNEYASALFLLGWMAPEESSSQKDLLLAFRQMPIGWKENVVGAWSGSVQRRGHEVISGGRFSRWVYFALVDLLQSQQFFELSATKIDEVLRVCASDVDKFGDALVAIQLPRSIATSFPSRVMSKPPGNSPVVDCGIIQASLHEVNWRTTGKPSPYAEISVRTTFPRSQAFFRLLLAFVWFAEERTEESWEALLDQIRRAGTQRLRALPSSILALVPMCSAFSRDPFSFKHLEGLSLSDYEATRVKWNDSRSFLPWSDLHLFRDGKKRDTGWDQFVESFPRIATRIAFSPEEFETFKLERISTEFPSEVATLLRECPEIAARHVLQWGSLESRDRTLLDELILRFNSMPVDVEDYDTVSVTPFKVALGSQNALLAAIGPALVQWHVSGGFQHRYAVQGGAARQGVLHVVDRFGLSMESLRQVAQDSDAPRPIRAGALAIFWMSAGEQAQTDEARPSLNALAEWQLYCAVQTEANEHWLASALISGVLKTKNVADAAALTVASHLLERCSSGRGPYGQLVSLIRTWQEASTAPVHARQVLQQWLSYRFAPES